MEPFMFFNDQNIFHEYFSNYLNSNRDDEINLYLGLEGSYKFDEKIIDLILNRSFF